MKRLFGAYSGKRPDLALAVVFFLFILSGAGLLPRIGAEKAGRTAAILLDFSDIRNMSAREGMSPGDIWAMLSSRGASGIMVSELTGLQLSQGIIPSFYGQAQALPDDLRGMGRLSSATALLFPPQYPFGRDMASYLIARFPGTMVAESSGRVAALIPRTQEELLMTGVLPDLEALDFARKEEDTVFYRVAPALPSDTAQSIASLNMLLQNSVEIRAVAPSGEVALGYPDLRPLADAVKKAGRSVAMVEFSRQVGAPQLNWLAFPSLLPLHSVTNEELLSRNISRPALHERLLRAVKERSIRLLLFRPSVMEASPNPLETLLKEVEDLARDLSGYGVRLAWGEPLVPWNNGAAGAVALATAFLYSLLRYLRRFFESPGERGSSCPWEVSGRGAAVFCLLAATVAGALFILPSAGRIIGALTAVFVVVEASFLALDEWERPWAGLVGSFLFAVAGGLAIAAFFSDPVHMLRLRSFSGVKATLFLPPLLVLLMDLKRRIHPESLREIFGRPPLWGEIFLLFLLLAGAALVLFRSDNVQFVPAFEVRMRDFLERILVARPRNKEIFIGYPCLMLWYFIRKRNMWPKYREVLRMGTVIGFSSAVNSFCHFHTPLYFILFRQFNGLWTGVAAGMIGVAILRWILLPLWEKYGRLLTD